MKMQTPCLSASSPVSTVMPKQSPCLSVCLSKLAWVRHSCQYHLQVQLWHLKKGQAVWPTVTRQADASRLIRDLAAHKEHTHALSGVAAVQIQGCCVHMICNRFHLIKELTERRTDVSHMWLLYLMSMLFTNANSLQHHKALCQCTQRMLLCSPLSWWNAQSQWCMVMY